MHGQFGKQGMAALADRPACGLRLMRPSFLRMLSDRVAPFGRENQ